SSRRHTSSKRDWSSDVCSSDLKRGRRRRSSAAPEGVDPAAATEDALRTLEVWDEHLATVGSQLLYARLRLLRDLVPHLQEAYREVSANQSEATAVYRSSLHPEAAEAIAEGHVPEIA